MLSSFQGVSSVCEGFDCILEMLRLEFAVVVLFEVGVKGDVARISMEIKQIHRIAFNRRRNRYE